jgi:hypothetical protein
MGVGGEWSAGCCGRSLANAPLLIPWATTVLTTSTDRTGAAVHVGPAHFTVKLLDQLDAEPSEVWILDVALK